MDAINGDFKEDGVKMRRNNNELENNNLELSLSIAFSSSTGTNPNTAKNIEAKATSNGGHAMFLSNKDGLISLQQQQRNTGVAQRWFPEAMGGGFVDPWSLAARQQKAILEQAHQKLSSNSSSLLQRASVVGWPPIRAFRKNLIAPIQPSKPREQEVEANEVKLESNKDTMYVKVYMEGFAVGRKIDLKALDSYDSLSTALQNMFHNFLSAKFSNNWNKEEGCDNIVNQDYILLYEDNEGDRLLVGDVPWEMFITSVKRLLIAQDPKTLKKDEKILDAMNN